METNDPETVLYAQEGAIVTLTLNRPDSLNSLSLTMARALTDALERAERDDSVRALVLTGAGRGFCSGADLSAFGLDQRELRPEDVEPGPAMEAFFNPMMRRLMRVRVPTVCAVNGVAAGAGASLALMCDVAIAAREASFIQAFSKIGLAPDCGATWLLPQRVGLARALALAMTGDALPAAEAQAMGMIWDVADDALGAATAMAERLAAMPTRALVATRELLRGAHTHTLDEQLDVERDMQSRLGFTQDFIEGVTAFLQKRKPEFSGR
ncbi:MAG: enoyl-CoA hydratase-related protein [Ottowia sp.]|nr:enoyl-CoA hydratase-related protein [Ottowia sp.]